MLFRRLLLFLCEGEAFGFLTACRPFPNVVSSLAVAHRALTLTLFQVVPSFFASPPENRLLITAERAHRSQAAFFVFLPSVIPGNGTISGGVFPFWPNVDSNSSLPLAISVSAMSA